MTGPTDSPKVAITDYPFLNVDIEKRELARIGAEVWVAQCKTEKELIQLCHDADGILNTYARMTAKVIASLSRCKIIARYGIGVDNIDVPAATARGIIVTNVPDYASTRYPTTRWRYFLRWNGVSCNSMQWSNRGIGATCSTGPFLDYAVEESVADQQLKAVTQVIKVLMGQNPDYPDDFGLSAANTVLALAAGAEVAHTSVSALGERAGNAPYEDVALALFTMYGVDTGLKYEKIYEVSRLVQTLANVTVRPNRGIVGDMTYKIESGIIVSWYKNVIDENPLELLPFRWDLVGQAAPEAVLGKKSGLDSIGIWLKKLGVDGADKHAETLLLRVKEKAFEKKGCLSEDEFKAILKEVVGL